MMQFAQPLGLLALISIPVIVLLHLLRPRRRTITVSSTALWAEALRERQRGLGLQKLFRNLSLVLLVLAALIASLALAEPRWLTESTEYHDIVIVVDTSASMRARAPAGRPVGKDMRTPLRPQPTAAASPVQLLSLCVDCHAPPLSCVSTLWFSCKFSSTRASWRTSNFGASQTPCGYCFWSKSACGCSSYPAADSPWPGALKRAARLATKRGSERS